MGESTHTTQQSSAFAVIWQVYKIPILLGSLSLFCIVVSFALMVKSYQSSAPIQFSQDRVESTVAGVMAGLTIDIEGAVKNPGVYQLSIGSRVEDAITAAGGLSAQADGDRIAASLNRAAKLSDGAKLYIPKFGDTTTAISQSSPNTQSAFTGMVSVNAASQAQLEELTGVGPVTAKKIIAGRPYQTLEELVTKKAMGQSLFDKLKDQLSL